MENINYTKLVEKEIEQTIDKYAGGFGARKTWLKYPFGLVNARGRRINSCRYTGKRFRPLLLIEMCRAYDGNTGQAVKAAAALEIFHNFSLVHDDIMDQDEYRRWRLTVWKIYGTAQAINIGDILLILSQLTINDLKLPESKQTTIRRLMNRAFLQVAHGQCLDVAYEERKTVGVNDYLKMIDLKTAALVEAAAGIGASLAGIKTVELGKVKRFGRRLGLAYQIYDDMVGIWGDFKKTGKEAGGDIIKRKKNLPVIFAREEMSKKDRLKFEAIYAMPKISKQDISAAIKLIDKSGAKVKLYKFAKKYLDRAISELGGLAVKSEKKQYLNNFVQELVKISLYENN